MAEVAAHDEAVAFELGEDGLGGSGWHGGALGELVDRDRAGDLHVAAEERDAGVVFVDLARRDLGRESELAVGSPRSGRAPRIAGRFSAANQIGPPSVSAMAARPMETSSSNHVVPLVIVVRPERR